MISKKKGGRRERGREGRKSTLASVHRRTIRPFTNRMREEAHTSVGERTHNATTAAPLALAVKGQQARTTSMHASDFVDTYRMDSTLPVFQLDKSLLKLEAR